MTDWAKMAAGITPGRSLVEEAAKVLQSALASSEAQLQARVETLLGKYFLGAEVAKAMLNTQDIGAIAPLPKDIVEVLNRQSPVHEQGVLVKDSHFLAFIPDNVSLRMLSEALGGQAGHKLYSDWFIKENNPIADLTLSSVGQKGHWVLIPDKLPQGTERNGFDASVAVLNKNFPNYSQADVISFATTLLLNDFKNNERCYPDTWGWCYVSRADSGPDNVSCFGSGRSRAICIGQFSASGLKITWDGSGIANPRLGCAACWNFPPSR